MSFVDGWLQRLELEESQRSKASKGPSARPHPAGGVPKPPPDPPPDDVEEGKIATAACHVRLCNQNGQLCSCHIADLQFQRRHREVSKFCCRQHWRVKKELKFFRKVQKKVAEVMISQLSTSFWTMLILTNSVYLGIHVKLRP